MNCCFRAKHPDLPFSVLPGQEAILVAELRVATPGPFEAPMKMYVDDHGFREVLLTLRGTGVVAKESE